MTSHRLNPADLDSILALQLSVAWAGEAAGNPPRLGWWRTDLVDGEGGGDLFGRLAPRTAAWASLSLVRAAARKVDEALREKVARGESIWTPLHFGFHVDEQLEDRIAWHRSHESRPEEVLGAHYLPAVPWSKAGLEALLARQGAPSVSDRTVGREVAASGLSASEVAPLLFAALLPLTSSYPLPFVEAPA